MPKLALGKRKICAVNYSRIISLPKIWLENSRLKPDDFVELTMQEDGSLLIERVATTEGDSV